jgi:hypothetical protein
MHYRDGDSRINASDYSVFENLQDEKAMCPKPAEAGWIDGPEQDVFRSGRNAAKRRIRFGL